MAPFLPYGGGESPCSNARGETAKSLPGRKGKLGGPLDPFPQGMGQINDCHSVFAEYRIRLIVYLGFLLCLCLPRVSTSPLVL